MSLKKAFWLIGLWGLSAQAVCVNGHPSVIKEFRHSKIVAIVTVISARSVPESSDGHFYEGTIYEAKIERQFRGASLPTVQIFNENSSGRFDMTIGARYLLFIYQEHRKLRVDGCGNSGEVSKDSSVLEQAEKLARTTH